MCLFCNDIFIDLYRTHVKYHSGLRMILLVHFHILVLLLVEKCDSHLVHKLCNRLYANNAIVCFFSNPFATLVGKRHTVMSALYFNVYLTFI